MKTQNSRSSCLVNVQRSSFIAAASAVIGGRHLAPVLDGASFNFPRKSHIRIVIGRGWHGSWAMLLAGTAKDNCHDAFDSVTWAGDRGRSATVSCILALVPISSL